MASKNFTELKNGFANLVPLGKFDQESIDALYSTWADNFQAAPKLAEFLERKKITMSVDLVEKYGLGRMMSANLNLTGNIFSELENIKRFAANFGINYLDEQGLIEKAFRARIPLPKETIDIILSLSREQVNDIPLDKTCEEFIRAYISFWRIDQKSTLDIYKKIINSSLVMRLVFDKIRESIIIQSAEMFRDEFGSDYKYLEQEIQNRTRLLMEL